MPRPHKGVARWNAQPLNNTACSHQQQRLLRVMVGSGGGAYAACRIVALHDESWCRSMCCTARLCCTALQRVVRGFFSKGSPFGVDPRSGSALRTQHSTRAALAARWPGGGARFIPGPPLRWTLVELCFLDVTAAAVWGGAEAPVLLSSAPARPGCSWLGWVMGSSHCSCT